MILKPSADQRNCPRWSGKASLKLLSLLAWAAVKPTRANAVKSIPNLVMAESLPLGERIWKVYSSSDISFSGNFQEARIPRAALH